VDTFAEPALEAVAVEEPQKKLEVLFLAAVRCRREEHEMARHFTKNLAQAIALGGFHFVAPEMRRHLVGLIDDHEIPVRMAQPVLQVVVAGHLVEAHDDAIVLGERIAGYRGFVALAGKDVKAQLELVPELILPLGCQVPGDTDEAALHVAADHQLLDEQACHDGLSRAGVIRQQEAQRLAVEHLAVDGRDLMRQGLDE